MDGQRTLDSPRWRTGRRLPAAVCRGVLAVSVLAATLAPVAARADFTMCNNTGGRVGVAVGYKDHQSWVSEGWWNLPARSCETLLKGTLIARYYYVYAVDYDRGGEWSGQAFMCTREKEFTIRGTEDCLARGYDRTGFFEVDTGEQRAWTVQLTDAGEPGTPHPSMPGMQMIPMPPGIKPAPSALPGVPGR